MNRRFLKRSVLSAIALLLLGLPLILWGAVCFQRPPQTHLEKPLFQGISYRREYRSMPRPVMLHIVTVDLAAPGVRVLSTPGTPGADQQEFSAHTTSEFLTRFHLQLAINANFFYHFREKTPWDFYPHSGDRVRVSGQSISNRVSNSPVRPGWATLCFAATAQIVPTGECSPGTTQAVAGSNMLVSQGKPNSTFEGAADSDGLYSRTAVGIDQTGQTLWIVAIDDKQLFYSEGVTQAELATILANLGVYNALNLDGGGSTTLVAATPTGASVLNAPVHTKIPLRERPVANHLGFYALPLNH